MAELGGSVRWIIEADTSQFDEAVEHTQAKAQELGNTLQKQNVKGGIFSGLSSNISSTKEALSGLGKSLGSVAWGTFSAGATAAAGALTTLVAKGISGTDFLESARTQMAGLTGSMEAGNVALSKAAQFWQNNPFDRFTTTSATKQLIQFGRSVNQISDDLDLLGDISMSTGTPLDELARYFARTAASGRAMTMDIEMMSDRGIPIYQKLAEVTGKTTQGIRDMASKGEISFEIFEKAMKKAVNPEAMAEFENTLARQKDRLSGAISTLSGDLAGYKIVNDQLVISANGLEKAYTRLLKTLATNLKSDKLRSSMEKLGASFAKIVDKIEPLIPIFTDKLGSALDFIANHSATLIPILGGVLAVFGKFGANLPGIGGVISSVGSSFSGLVGNIKKLATANPVLTAFIGLFGAGFVSAMKNSESFRKSVGELFTAIGNLAKSLMPVIKAFLNVFVQIISSKAVIGILQSVVKVLTLVANVLNKIPTDVLTGLITSLLMFKAFSVSPIVAIATGITLLVSSISALIEEAGGLGQIGELLSNVWNNIANGVKSFIGVLGKVGSNVLNALSTPIKNALEFLKKVPKTLLTIGNNIMVGLFNGLVDGSKKVFDFVKGVALSIINTFKSILGIHSPSTVMESQGRFVVLGLANGISKNSSIAEKAMDALATDVLNTAEKVVNTKVEFGLLDYNSEYKQWKKISSLFAKGSSQYAQAMEKMEDARKNVNLQIIKLQNEYNDTLDQTISKVASMYGTFDEVDLSGGMNITDITSNLDQQIAKLTEYANAQEAISNLDLDPKFIEELMAMGVDATTELSAIASASAEELSTLNNLWVKKQEVANRAAVKQTESLKKDTLKQISQLKDGIEGETVEVSEVGGRLVSSIGDGITGAIPTLQASFDKLNDYIAKQMAGTAEEVNNAGAIDPEDFSNNFAKGFEGAMDDIKSSVEGSAKGLFGIIAGVFGFSAFTKIFGKGLSKNIGDKIGSVFSSIGKLGKSAKDIKKTSESVNNVTQVAKGISKSAESLTTAGQQMTKTQSAMKTMRSGILNIVLLAGAIVVMGFALKSAYDSIPNDIGGLSAKLGVVAGVVTVMGGLAALGGQFDDSIKAGLKLIAVIAGEVALTALAISVANALIPDDLGNLIPKLEVMGGVITAMGVLAGIGGQFDESIKEGLKLVAAIAGDIALTGIAMGVANAMIPNDLGQMVGKLGVMGLAIAEFGVLAGIISAVPIDLKSGLAVIVGIAGDIALVGLALGVADKSIQSNFDVFIGKLGIMGAAITEFGVLAGVIGAVMSTGIGAVFMGAGLTALLGICGGIVATATAVGEIDKQISTDIDGVKAKIGLMQEAIQSMVTANFGSLIENLGNTINVGLIGVIAEGFAKLGETLSKIAALEIDSTIIQEKVEVIKQCVESLAELQAGSFWKNLENAASTTVMTKTVENIYNIVEKVSQCVVLLKSVQDIVGNQNEFNSYVETIKWTVERLADLQTGDFWNNLKNTFATGVMTKTVENIHGIVTKISECVLKLKDVDDAIGDQNTFNGYVETIKWTVERLANLQTGDFWQRLKDTAATGLIKDTTNNISSIINEITDIVSKLKSLDDNYGDGKAEAFVARAIKIAESFGGVKLKDGSTGWLSPTTYERVATDLESVKKTSGLISEIVKAASDTVKTIQEFTSSFEDKDEIPEIKSAVLIMQQFSGVTLPDGGHGWFSSNTYERVASDLEQVEKVATALSDIIKTASDIAKNIKDFNGASGDLKSYVEKANEILSEFANIQIPQSWVEDTANKSGHLNTTAGNVGNILTSAMGIVDSIIKFTEQKVDVPSLVKKANEIIQSLAEIKIDQEYLQETADNAGRLNTVAENVDKILGSAEGIVEKIVGFNKISGGVEAVKGYIKQANEIIAKFSELNIEGGKNYEELSANAKSLVDIVSSVKDILDKAGTTVDTVRAFIKKYDITKLEEDVKNINNNLKVIAGIKVEGLGNGEEKVAKLESVKQIIAKITEIAQAMQSVPDAANKITNIETVITFIQKELSALPDVLKAYDTEFVAVGDSYAKKFAEGWTAQYDKAVEDGKTMSIKYAEGIRSTFEQFRKTGSDLQGELWGAIEAKMQDEYNQGATLASKIIEGLKSKIGEFEGVGKNAVQGFINGANSGNPYAAGAQIADKFLRGLKDRGKQGSPWKTTIQSGVWAVEGLIDGLKDSEKALVSEANNLADEVIDALSMEDVSISPSLDANINPFVSNLPSMNFDEEYQTPTRDRRNVIIEQTNNNYTQYSLERLNRDLAWELSKV